ncbi:MAG: membrane associated rhomboid family serine protease [Paracoccaceae bacterium]|jgi:membrane associated rhomboid family serine protease
MFPIRDHNPSGRTPYVVYALIALNVAMYLVTLSIKSDPNALALFYANWAVVPFRVSDGTNLISLVSSMFLHGGLLHLAGNMLFLWIFGDNLEDEMGHLIFLAFYLIGGVGSGLIHVMSAPGSIIPTVGASGAIAAVMGGYLLLFPKARVDIIIIFIVFFKIFPVPAWVMLGLWFGLQLLGGVNSDPTTGGVAYWAHAGGFVVGLILLIPLWRKRGGTQYWSVNHGKPPHPENIYSPSRIPKIQR